MKAYKVQYTFLNRPPDDYGVVLAESAGKARYKTYLLSKDVWDGICITHIKLRRAPEYDGIGGLVKGVWSKEYADMKKEEIKSLQ